MLSPVHPKYHLGNEMSLHTYTTYVKGILGLGQHVLQAEEHIKHLKNVNCYAKSGHLDLLPSTVQMYIKSIVIGYVFILVYGQFPIHATEIASTVDDQNDPSFKMKQGYY